MKKPKKSLADAGIFTPSNSLVSYDDSSSENQNPIGANQPTILNINVINEETAANGTSGNNNAARSSTATTPAAAGAVRMINSSNLSIGTSSISSTNNKKSDKNTATARTEQRQKNLLSKSSATSMDTHNLLSSIKNKTLSASRLLVKTAQQSASRSGSPTSSKTSSIKRPTSYGSSSGKQPIDLETNIVTTDKNCVIQEDDSDDDDDDDYEDEDDDDKENYANTDEDEDSVDSEYDASRRKSTKLNKKPMVDINRINNMQNFNSSLFDEDDDEESDATDQVYAHNDEDGENLDSFHRDLDEDCYYINNRGKRKEREKEGASKQQNKSSIKNILSKITNPVSSSTQHPKESANELVALNSKPALKLNIVNTSHHLPDSSKPIVFTAPLSSVRKNSMSMNGKPSAAVSNINYFHHPSHFQHIHPNASKHASNTNLNLVPTAATSMRALQASHSNIGPNSSAYNPLRPLVSFSDDHRHSHHSHHPHHHHSNPHHIKNNNEQPVGSQRITEKSIEQTEQLVSKQAFFAQTSTASVPSPLPTPAEGNTVAVIDPKNRRMPLELPLSVSFTSNQTSGYLSPPGLSQQNSETPSTATTKGLNKTRGSKAMRVMGNSTAMTMGNGPLKSSGMSNKSNFSHNQINKKLGQKRLFFKNGNINISRCNIDKRRRRYLTDIFTTLIDLKWRYNLLVFLLGFFISWNLFASIWYTISYVHGDLEPMLPENHTACVSGLHGFAGAILFSIETQQTIGYGARYTTEKCPEAIFVMMIQSSVGVMIQSFMVGVVFAKLSRPKKRSETLMFSKNAVISLRDGRMCLICRVGDMRKSHIVEAHVRMYLIKKRVTLEGEILPLHMYDLNVGWDKGLDRLFLVWPLTIEHYIDEHSPFWTISAEDLRKERFEIAVILEGIVESTGMTTQARSSYLVNEILWGHRFEKLITFQKEDGTYKIDYSRFDMTVPIDTPTCSAKEIAELKEEEKYNYSHNFNYSSPSTAEIMFYDQDGNDLRKQKSTDQSLVRINDDEVLSESSLTPAASPSMQIKIPTQVIQDEHSSSIIISK